jgi:hypothetical protein
MSRSSRKRRRWPTRLVNRTVNRERDRVLAQFRKEPRRSLPPRFNVESDKQRRAYFATDGFGHGNPVQAPDVA